MSGSMEYLPKVELESRVRAFLVKWSRCQSCGSKHVLLDAEHDETSFHILATCERCGLVESVFVNTEPPSSVN